MIGITSPTSSKRPSQNILPWEILLVENCCCKGDSDVISSHQLFSAILWGKLCKMFVIRTSADVNFSIR